MLSCFTGMVDVQISQSQKLREAHTGPLKISSSGIIATEIKGVFPMFVQSIIIHKIRIWPNLGRSTKGSQ